MWILSSIVRDNTSCNVVRDNQSLYGDVLNAKLTINRNVINDTTLMMHLAVNPPITNQAEHPDNLITPVLISTFRSLKTDSMKP